MRGSRGSLSESVSTTFRWLLFALFEAAFEIPEDEVESSLQENSSFRSLAGDSTDSSKFTFGLDNEMSNRPCDGMQ